MQRAAMPIRMRAGVLGALPLLVAGMSVGPVLATPAHAAYGPCNTTSWRDVPTLSGKNDYRIPARSGQGISCYLGYRQGSSSAVEALQQAITICYPGTWAARKIHDSDGIDGIYGTGTVEAVRWLQINKLNLAGSADGVYGPQTRAKMRWPHYYDRGALLNSCTNPSTL